MTGAGWIVTMATAREVTSAMAIISGPADKAASADAAADGADARRLA
jgi:hypothetical protein